MKKILPILGIVVVAVVALVWASIELLPSEPSADRVAQRIELPTPRPVQATERPTPTPPPTPPPVTPQPTPQPTPNIPGMPTPTPRPDLPEAVTPQIDTSETDSAVVSVRYRSQSKLKVQVKKGGQTYTHDLAGDNLPARYPLNMGTGDYTVEVYRNVGGTGYRMEAQQSFSGEWADPNTPFLQSIQRVHWDPSMQPVYDALLMSIDRTQQDARDAIFDELADTLLYDWDIYDKLPSGYLPDIEATYRTRKGICYDFSSLFAGMLRSRGIPTKLLIGYADPIYGLHAWNEVLIDGEWVVVDLTVVALNREWGQAYEFAQRDEEYHPDKQF